MENTQQRENATAYSLTLSEFEELTWLRHQQSEAGVGQYAIAFQLSGQVDTGRLLNAIENACGQYSPLQVLYQFDDDQGLVKVAHPPLSHIQKVEPLRHRQAALDDILQVQMTPFDLHAQSALQFTIYLLDDNSAVVGAVVHPIVQGQVSWQQIFTLISQNYNQPLALNAPSDVASRVTQLGSTQQVKANIAPLKRSLTHAVQNIAYQGESQRATNALANKFVANVAVSQFPRLLQTEDEKHDVLVSVAALFAKQLAQLTGKSSIQLSLPRDLDDRYFELNGSMIESNLATLALESEAADVVNVAKQIDQQLHQPEAITVSHDAPHVLVSWLADPTTFLRLEDIAVDRLALSPINPPFEVALAMGVNCRGEAVLELTTSAELSSFAGGWLLENLLGVFHGQPSVSFDHLNLDIESSTVQADLVESTAAPDHATLILNEFRQALNEPTMGLDDDFFDLGGHSLIATRVIGRLLNQHHIEVHINDLFSYSTARGLAEKASYVHAAESEVEHPSTTELEPSEFPLSLAQNSLWKAKQKYAEFGLHHIFNIPFALRFLDKVDEAAFGHAFRDLLVRHPGLRTQFDHRDGVPFQRIVDVVDLDDYKWFWQSSETDVEPYAAALKRESGYGFDLAKELPLRLKFFRDSESNLQYLSLLFHHIVLDEWSVNILIDELNHAYQSRIRGNAPTWRFEPLPFHQYAQKQHQSGMNQQHQAFWKQHLNDATWSDPIFDATHPLSVRGEQDDNQGGWVEFKLEKSVSDGLYQLAKRQNASLFNVMYAGIITSLNLLGAPSNMVVGTPASGRLDADFFDTIGYFTTMVVHMTRVTGELSVLDVIEQVKQTINGSMPYTDIPIDLIEEALLGEGVERDNHIFEVFIQLHAKNKLNGFLSDDKGGQIEFQQVDPDKSEGGLGLQFEVMEERVDGEQRIRVLMSYLSKHYSPAQVELLSNTTCDILQRFAALGEQDLALSELKHQLKAENPYIID